VYEEIANGEWYVAPVFLRSSDCPYEPAFFPDPSPIPLRLRSQIWDRSDNSVDRSLRRDSECAAVNL